MKIGRSSNPALSEKRFKNFAADYTQEEAMTINGTLNKTFLLFLLVLVSASLTWKMAFQGAMPTGLMAVGGIGGFIVAIVTIFKQRWAPFLAPIYAVLEGLFLGAISAMFAAVFEGIVLKAVLITFGILFTMLFIYRTGLIKVTEKFKFGLMAAMGGIIVMYLMSFVLGMFGISMTFLHDGGTLSIVISLAIVVIASLVLLWDFDTIEKTATAGAPKYMEWYMGFSLMLTLVWLYLEVLQLIALLSGND